MISSVCREDTDTNQGTVSLPSTKPPASPGTAPRKPQRLAADNLADLAACGADGFQQAIVSDIPDDRYLKNIVNNQISGQQNQKQVPCFQ